MAVGLNKRFLDDIEAGLVIVQEFKSININGKAEPGEELSAGVRRDQEQSESQDDAPDLSGGERHEKGLSSQKRSAPAS